MSVLQGISSIRARAGFSITNTGDIVTDAESIVKEGSVLVIDSDSSVVISGGSMTFNSGSVVSSGGTSMNINGVSVQSVGNKFILRGAPDRILVVNGVQTTFGSVGASRSAVPQVEVPRKKYKLAEGTLISNLVLTGHGDCSVDAKFLHENLGVTVSGSADVKLPARTFSHLSLSISGSGDICGADGDRATKTFDLRAAISGSGDISDIIVLDAGIASVSGSGDITIDAVDPSKVVRSSGGSGRIRVRRTTNASLLDEPDVERTPAVTAATGTSAAKKRTFDSDEASKRSRKEE